MPQDSDLPSQTVDAILPDGNIIRFRPFSPGDGEAIADVYHYGHYDGLCLQPGAVVVDIGAHIGAFALQAARLVGRDGLVVAVEPEPENFRLLTENIRLNHLENVIPVRKAVSSRRGRGRLFMSSSTLAHSLILERGPEWIEVEVTTLEGLQEELDVVPRALKIDAEGAAVHILSRPGDLRRCQRVAVAAYHVPLEDVQVCMKLQELGFETEVQFLKGSVYRSPFAPYLSLVLGIARQPN